MYRLRPDELERAMTARGLSQTALAQLAGVHRVTICKALCGRPVQLETAVELQRALDRLPALPLPSLDRIADQAPRTRRAGRAKRSAAASTSAALHDLEEANGGLSTAAPRTA